MKLIINKKVKSFTFYKNKFKCRYIENEISTLNKIKIKLWIRKSNKKNCFI